MTPQHPWPGADQERVRLAYLLREVEQVVRERALSPFCRRGKSEIPCQCFRCTVLRICRYGVNP